MDHPTCEVAGCAKPTRSRAAKLCKMHYHRQYRHGSVDRTAHTAGISASKGRRYRAIYRAGHPLARSSGRVYEHRVVLYDQIGPGPHPCNWCGTTVHWDPVDGPALQVDHLNGVGDDNRPENLVASCNACNVARAQQARSAALRAAGWWSQHDTIAGLRGQRRRDPLPIATQGDTLGGHPHPHPL
ncbi:hypothetical protein [Micromonospora carbonacea]|uniref:hypothetical protein n=1 Tax=Micromonospora carbonacea TaxID=47853 RepID=UPI0033EAF0E1